MSKKVKVFSDGGARGNPGPAGCGFVVEDENGKIIEKGKKYLGETTNNVAEYMGLILALEKAKELGAEEVDCFLDSELVVKQMNKEYKVKNLDLAKLFVKIFNLSQGFLKISFNHVYREKNKLADSLANEAMDSASF